MARGLLVNLSTADLNTLLADITTALKSNTGRVVTSVGFGDTTTTKDWILRPVELLEEVNYALSLRNSGTRRYTRTAIRYL